MANKRIRTGSGQPLGSIGTRVLEQYKKLGPKALDAAANEWKRKTILLLSQRGHGRIYRRGKKATHQASAPGEVPARDDGNLVRSIGWRRLSRFVRRLGSGSKVGLYLERGTRKRIKPRPWLRRSMSAAGPAMTLAIRRVFRGG